jgi:hypothetical protein
MKLAGDTLSKEKQKRFAGLLSGDGLIRPGRATLKLRAGADRISAYLLNEDQSRRCCVEE